MSEWQNGAMTEIACGELAGSTTAAVCPDIVTAGLVYIKAASDNTGKVYIGGAGVTKADGTTDVTTGYPLAASEQLTLNIDNLSRLYRICDNATDDLLYFITR
jgi:hypothetical protein